MMFVWCKHSGVRVMSNNKMGGGDSNRLALYAAKNMTVSGQVLMRDYEDFDILGVSCNALPQGVCFSYHYTENITFHDGIPYPDILCNKETLHVKSHCTQGIWVHFCVGENTPTGDYKQELTFHTSGGDFKAVVCLKVYSTVLPSVKDGAFSQEYFFSATEYFSYKDVRLSVADRLPNFYRFERYSDKWWTLMSDIAQKMKEIRANVFWLPTLELLCDAGSCRVSEKEWKLDFTLVDKMIELFLSKGNFRHIVIKDHIVPNVGTAIRSIDEKGKMCTFPVFGEDAEAWADVFYPALYAHFKEKGWLSLLLMHLQDEPHNPQYWQWARKKCRTYMPEIVCGESLDIQSVAEQMDGYFDWYIPRIDIYEPHADFYKQCQAAGKTLWTYSCCYPEEHHWLNRFIDQPHVYIRQMMWACFSQGITGYLHWGFNFWDSEILSGIQAGARFKGDGFIVYPDAEHGALALSARFVATRDGAQEYELLALLAQKDESKAKEIAAKVAVNFTQFNTDENCVDEARKQILELLEKETEQK